MAAGKAGRGDLWRMRGSSTKTLLHYFRRLRPAEEDKYSAGAGGYFIYPFPPPFSLHVLHTEWPLIKEVGGGKCQRAISHSKSTPTEPESEAESRFRRCWSHSWTPNQKGS